jgi:tripartite-type tricarboxylate transporter receptor subunit TctC
MRTFKTIATGVIGGALLVAGISASANAQFYRGKTVNVIINYSAGGNTDIQIRSLLRFMKKYVAGKPRFVIRHLPGAGGIVGANFLAEAAKPDGRTIGGFTIPVMSQVMQDPAMRADLSKFLMVGALAQQTISHMRKDVIPGGLKSPYDILKVTKVFRTAGHGPSSSKDLRIRLFMELIGIKHKHITGYKSAGRIRAAIMKKEVDFTADSLTGYAARVKPQLIDTGVSIPIWHIGHPTKDGGLRRSSTVAASIPSFLEIYQRKFGKGKRPSGIKWKAVLHIAKTRELLRSVFLPEGAPKQALADLRAAWDKTMLDKGYQEEYQKLNASPLVSYDGQTATGMMKDAVHASPELQKFLLDYAAMARS